MDTTGYSSPSVEVRTYGSSPCCLRIGQLGLIACGGEARVSCASVLILVTCLTTFAEIYLVGYLLAGGYLEGKVCTCVVVKSTLRVVYCVVARAEISLHPQLDLRVMYLLVMVVRYGNAIHCYVAR